MEINICLPTILMWTAELHILDPCPYVYWLHRLNIRKGKPGHSGHEWQYVVSTYCTDLHRFYWISMNKLEPDVVNQLEDNWERVANLQHTTIRVTWIRHCGISWPPPQGPENTGFWQRTAAATIGYTTIVKLWFPGVLLYNGNLTMV